MPSQTRNDVGGQNAGPRNSIGLGRHALRELFELMDAREGGDGGAGPADAGASGRQFARHAYRLEAAPVELMRDDGSSTSVRMAVRNLSAKGIALLHSGFLHEGSEVRVTLPHVNKTLVPVRGIVRRCRHVRGIIHELGIEFYQEIDLRDYSWLDASHAWFRFDRVHAHDLKGTVLYVDDSDVDHAAFLNVVRGSQLTVRKATNADEAITEILKGVDVAVIDYHLGSENAEPLFAAIRQLNITTPLVLATVAEPSAVRGLLKRLRPASFLKKPLDKLPVLCALAEFVDRTPMDDEDDQAAA